MSGWVWVVLGAWVLYNLLWTLFCLEFGYRYGKRQCPRAREGRDAS